MLLENEPDLEYDGKYTKKPIFMHPIENIVMNLPGWSSLDKCSKLYSLVGTNKPKITVEVGLFGGRGGFSMALAHKDIKGGMCFGIDPYSAEASVEGTDEDVNKEWWGNLDYEKLYRDVMIQVLAHDLTRELNVLRMRSADAVDLFRDKSIGLLVIDGNHTKEVCSEDIMKWAPKVADDGIILMDDLGWAGVAQSIHLLEHFGFKQEEFYDDPAGSQWGVYKKMQGEGKVVVPVELQTQTASDK